MKKITNKIFDERVRKLFNNTYVRLGDYPKNTNQKIQMECTKCKKSKLQKISHILSGHGCSTVKCRTREYKTFEDAIISKLNKYHPTLIINKISPYNNIYTVWGFKCSLCGIKNKTKISNIVWYTSGTGCAVCNKNIKLDICLKNTPFIRVGNTVSSRKNVLLKCKVCNTQFSNTPHNILCKHRKCPSCYKTERSVNMTDRWREFYLSGKSINSYSGIKNHKKGWLFGYFYQSSYEMKFLQYCTTNKIDFQWQKLRLPYSYGLHRKLPFLVKPFLSGPSGTVNSTPFKS